MNAPVDTGLAEALALRDRNALTRVRQTIVARDAGMVTCTDHPARLAFASNDYLGLADDPRLVEAFKEGLDRYGVGAGASAVAGGHFASHAAVETLAAEIVAMPRALLFESGYMANLAILSALPARGDVIYADRGNHACLNDGAQLSRATFRRYRHVDANHLADLLATHDHQRGRAWIVTDTVFSMDGHVAPLADIFALAHRHEATVVLDDAHGFGVWGREGAGTLAHLQLEALASNRCVLMATLGKAAGIGGAFVAGSRPVVEWLLQTARTYLFTTAMPPAQAHALHRALTLVRQADSARGLLQQHIGRMALAQRRWLEVGALLPPEAGLSSTAIQPLIVGTNERALTISAQLSDCGLWVPAIRPPTVPLGTARLRLTLSAAHTSAHIETVVAALDEILAPAA